MKKPPISVPQARILEALLTPLTYTLDTQFKRRTNTINALVAYCHIQELTIPAVQKVVPKTPMELEEPSANIHAELQASAMVKTPGERLFHCFIYIVKALTLKKDDPNINLLYRTFRSHRDTAQHFKAIYLKLIDKDKKLVYPLCIDPIVPLRHKIHL